jgi:N-acetyl-gamma-glutamyl-phosphate reductase
MLQQEVPAQALVSETTHFGDQIMSHYKAFDHQALGEINQSVNQLQADYANELIFCRTGDFAEEFFLYTEEV